MTKDQGPDFLFVINPTAGNNNTSWQDIIHNYFTEKPFRIDYFTFTGKPNIAELKSRIEELKPARVVAVGGDGTVTLVANLVAGTEIALGILPAGSANGMAKEIGLPDEPEAALDMIVNGHVKSCDYIQINNYRCLHLSDLGLNAQLIKYFDEGKLRGKIGYARMILKTLWHKEKMQVIMNSRELEVRRNAFMVVLANASMYGTGAVINPLGQLDDGEFEVVIVRKLSFWSLMKMLLHPGPFNPKHIEIFPSTSVEISTLKHVHFQVDGEYIGKINKVTARIVPANIRLILPPVKS